MSRPPPRIADHFVVVGLPEDLQYCEAEKFEGPESPTKRSDFNSDPITDVVVIFKGLGDPIPKGYECIEKTPAGHSANLNFGSFRSPEVYLCYKRGRDKPPITDMGVMQEGARLLENAAAVFQTPTGRIANINNASSPALYVTYSRAPTDATPNTLVLMDICVVIAGKGEELPHTFCKIEQKLNTSLLSTEVYLCYRKARLRDNVYPYKPGKCFWMELLNLLINSALFFTQRCYLIFHWTIQWHLTHSTVTSQCFACPWGLQLKYGLARPKIPTLSFHVLL